jgi:thiamine transporter ThiT
VLAVRVLARLLTPLYLEYILGIIFWSEFAAKSYHCKIFLKI